ncbi:MAG: metallophosphoesterase [Clostridia bacterium]|nr:metallophosphoesterase [Clostridia bacterium]
MIELTTKIEQINIEPGKRILVTSDIHGHLSYFKEILKKASFSDEDILFIVGDMIEKGPENLETLHYIMELCKQGNVIPLIGNVDAYRLKLIYELSEENVCSFYNYVLNLRKWVGTSFYEELAAECGYTINNPADILLSKQAVITRFEDEFKFIANLPTVVETKNYIFVHGGLREKQVSDNVGKSVFELTKFDAFAENTSNTFDKYVIAGHWPVVLYGSDIPQMNPIINRDKKIISIDGGCGVKKDGQLNLLIIPDINCSVDEISHISYDEIPTVYALENQNPSADSVYISWINREIRILNKGEEFSCVEHIKSGRKLHIPNSYLRNETECFDYTDYILPVKKGDRLSIISKNSKGCIAKIDGVVGWYCGKFLNQ